MMTRFRSMCICLYVCLSVSLSVYRIILCLVSCGGWCVDTPPPTGRCYSILNKNIIHYILLEIGNWKRPARSSSNFQSNERYPSLHKQTPQISVSFNLTLPLPPFLCSKRTICGDFWGMAAILRLYNT